PNMFHSWIPVCEQKIEVEQSPAVGNPAPQIASQAPGADSLEEPTIPESLPAASAPREAELPECKAAPRGHKGGKKRSKDQDAEEAEDRPKKVTRSLSAFFPRAQEPGDDQGDQGKGL
ncbi:unnamed protein product, partial [Effrenium voratum]